jgi:hypothetical protein
LREKGVRLALKRKSEGIGVRLVFLLFSERAGGQVLKYKLFFPRRSSPTKSKKGQVLKYKFYLSTPFLTN